MLKHAWPNSWCWSGTALTLRIDLFFTLDESFVMNLTPLFARTRVSLVLHCVSATCSPSSLFEIVFPPFQEIEALVTR